MSIKIGNRSIGKDQKTYVIAEAGVNHLGELNRAFELIDKAKEAGADAIKFQTYKADKLTTPNAPRFWDWEGEKDSKGSQFDSYSLLDKLPEDAYEKMFAYCEKKGIEFLSTPFDIEAVDLLDKLGMRAFKVASCDITNHPLLRVIAKKGKPILLSTGAANIDEIHSAVRIIEAEGNKQIIILHCILCYPTKPEDMNLNMIKHLSMNFPNYPIGLSDHSLGIIVPPLAVAHGACVIEKHYTIDKNLPLSADHWLSVDPPELKTMIDFIRTAEVAGGLSTKGRIPSEEKAFLFARRSIIASENIKEGEVLTTDNITAKRPGTSVSPIYFDIFIGRKAKRNINKNEFLTWDDVC